MILTSESQYIADKFFSFLNEKKLSYVLIGDPSDFLERGKDWDLFTMRYDDFFSAVKEFCALENVSIVNIIHHATGIKFYFRSKTGAENRAVISGPDALFFPTWKIKGDIGLSMVKLLDSPRFDEFGYLVPSPKYAFIFLLIKKIDKGVLTPNHGSYLSQLGSEDPEGIRKLIKKIWTPPYAEMLIRATESGCWDKVIQSTPELRTRLQKNTTWSFKRAAWILKRLFLRLRFPVGLSVVLLGPDGSGKTSVSKKLAGLITRPFLGTAYVHGAGFFSRAKVLKWQQRGFARGFFSSRSSHDKKAKTDKLVTHPLKSHDQSPRGLFASWVKLLYLWIDSLLGWCTVVWPKLFQAKLILLDRYYHDILVDPQRYRYGGPMWPARWIAKLIPKPDLWILLDVPAEKLQERKQDVSVDESARQREEYLKLFREMKDGIVVDGSQSLDDVVADVNQAIIDFMCKRTEERFVRKSEA